MISSPADALSPVSMPSDSPNRAIQFSSVDDSRSRLCVSPIPASSEPLVNLLLAKKRDTGSFKLEAAASSLLALVENSTRKSPCGTAESLKSRVYASENFPLTDEIPSWCSALPFAGVSHIPSTTDVPRAETVESTWGVSRCESARVSPKISGDSLGWGDAIFPDKFPGPANFEHMVGEMTKIHFSVLGDSLPLGSGGFSRVYLTYASWKVNEDQDNGQVQVLKATWKSSSASHDLESEIVCRALDEWMPFVAWGHPLIDLDPNQSHYILPMKFYPYGDLHSRTGARRPNDFVMLTWMAQLMLGLQWLHRHSYVHCDLKARNVLIDECGRVAICDFGMAIFVPGVRDLPLKIFQNSPIPHTGGTRAYMAPEVRDKRYSPYKITPAIDVYGLAVLWLEMWSSEAVADELEGFGNYPSSILIEELINRIVPSKCSSFDLAPLHSIMVRMLSNAPYDRPTLDEIRHLPLFTRMFDFNDIRTNNSILDDLSEYLQC